MRSAARSGFALPAAIFALVLLSALVAGALFVSVDELRSGRSDTAGQRALALAEAALDSAVLAWDSRRNTGDSVGARFGTGWRSVPNAAVSIEAVRLQRRSVSMSASALAVGDGRPIPVRQSVAVALRLVGAGVAARAALVTPGTVVIDGGIVDGGDSVRVRDAARVCDEPQAAAGIVVADATRITCVGCGSDYGPAVRGSPAVDVSGAVNPGVVELGDETRATLAARAAIDVPAGSFGPAASIANGECDRSDRMNWGDPTGGAVCGDWYPIIHVRGDATIVAGAMGQGILLVDGSLRVEANARFAGIVVVAGGVVVDGLGAEIDGVVFALASDLSSPSRIVNGGAIRYASCAVRRATLGSARLVRTAGRSWVELR